MQLFVFTLFGWSVFTHTATLLRKEVSDGETELEKHLGGEGRRGWWTVTRRLSPVGGRAGKGGGLEEDARKLLRRNLA